jgi:hypothetical protein
MMIIRALSLAFLVTVFSIALTNQELLVKHIDSLEICADASDVVFQVTSDAPVMEKQSKPTFMQVEKINQHELPVQARIGYLLSRGF